MATRDPARSPSVLVVRFHPGTSKLRTDIIHRDPFGQEVLVHHHESTPESFGIEKFREAVQPSIDAGFRHAVIDLVEVRWAPSDVIQTLLVIEAFLRDGGMACVVANPNSRVMSVLSITGLVWHMKVRDTLEEAIASLAADEDAARG